MEDLKVTQGNWQHNDGQIYPQENGITLAVIPYFDKNNPAHVANGNLIAAAPDLLKALNDLVEDITFSKKDIPLGAIGEKQLRAAKDAISKAIHQ